MQKNKIGPLSHQGQELGKYLPLMTGPFKGAFGGESKISALVILSATVVIKLV